MRSILVVVLLVLVVGCSARLSHTQTAWCNDARNAQVVAETAKSIGIPVGVQRRLLLTGTTPDQRGTVLQIYYPADRLQDWWSTHKSDFVRACKAAYEARPPTLSGHG